MSSPTPPPIQIPPRQYPQPPLQGHQPPRKEKVGLIGYIAIAVPIILLLIILSAVIEGSTPEGRANQKARIAKAEKERVASEKAAQKLAAQPGMSPQSAIKVDAQKLWMDYTSNTVSADDKYKGKWVLVTGRIVLVSELLGEYHVQMANPEHGSTIVMIKFPGKDREEVKKFARGEVWDIPAKVEGETMGIVTCGF